MHRAIALVRLWRRSLALLAVLGGSAALAQDGGAASGRELTVFAAASLRDAFGRVAEDFERAHPGTRVRFNFAGSPELRTQLENGAAADVFASADTRQMEGARSGALVGPSRIFATNEPVVIVPRDNPAGLKSFADLPAARRLVLATPEVPIGVYTGQILEKAKTRLGSDFPARVNAKVVSRELNVRQVLTKVALGEADAGIVYRTDAKSAADKVQVLSIPPEFNVLAEYPIAVTAKPRQPELARAWVETVTGRDAAATLAEFGFGPPRH
jgi:molybdate transport system substrate-binding protein